MALASRRSKNGLANTMRWSCAEITPIRWLCCRGAYGRGRSNGKRKGNLEVTDEKREMAFEQKDNSGIVGVNDKNAEDSHPDRSGSAKIGGVDYWVNGWLKKTKTGEPYLSLSFRRKDAATSSGGGPPKRDDDSTIPF